MVCGYFISMRIMAEQQTKSECNLQNAVVDARRFILENFELVKDHPLETYGSALVWLPEQSHIWMIYGDKRKSVWKVVIGLWKAWDACEQVLQAYSGKIVFSPDGSCFVSVTSAEETLLVCKMATGEWEAELGGHLDTVTLAFSPDGTHVVSGSEDTTVCIWNVVTGELEAELKGHSDHVNSIIISPDGSHVVSGSDDHTVCIWNVMTGSLRQRLMHIIEIVLLSRYI